MLLSAISLMRNCDDMDLTNQKILTSHRKAISSNFWESSSSLTPRSDLTTFFCLNSSMILVDWEATSWKSAFFSRQGPDGTFPTVVSHYRQLFACFHPFICVLHLNHFCTTSFTSNFYVTLNKTPYWHHHKHSFPVCYLGLPNNSSYLKRK